MKKTLFALAAIAAVMFSLSSCSNKGQEGDENAQAGEATEAAVEAPEDVKPFDFTPAAPENGKKKAVVELGASGFNLFIITMDENKNWKQEKAEFGQSNVAEGATGVDAVKGKLNDYIKTILAEGVDGKDIHFVVSSGAAKEPIVATIESGLKALGYVVNKVTAEQEAEYAFQCVMPKEYEGSAFVVDLGSGNTKVSWKEGGQAKSVETFGAKYFQKGEDDTKVYNEVKSKLASIPATNAKTLFIIGGVPHKMAKKMKKGNERYTVLTTDVTFFDDIAKDDDKNKAGLNIYKGIVDATNPGQVVFDWDANFTIGFLLNMPY